MPSTYEIHTAKIETWAAAYKGDKFHAILCDPPYGISFMESWDSHGTNADFQEQVRRWGVALMPLLYPGAMVLMFGGTRTWHRLAAGMEDAGFKLWDTLMWLHGQGFPKATAMDLLIDKKLKKQWPVIRQDLYKDDIRGGKYGTEQAKPGNATPFLHDITAAASDTAKQWTGYKTNQLKPAWEPCLMFITPHPKDSHAELAMKYGTGALNIDGCRVGTVGGTRMTEGTRPEDAKFAGGGIGSNKSVVVGTVGGEPGLGRYPANLILDEETAPMVDEQSGERPGGCYPSGGRGPSQFGAFQPDPDAKARQMDDSGGASRFFYCAKASPAERNGGLGEEFPVKERDKNNHPCVKPIRLCEYLARLILPPASVQRRILVPFSGSGSEMIGCLNAGWDRVIGVEMSADYCKIAGARIAGISSDE